MSKKINDELRAKYLEFIKDALSNSGEEVLKTGSNEICLPVVDSEGNDQYVVISVKVPTGSRDGDAYDGYAMAQEYEMKQREAEEKRKVAAAKKEEKIKRDALAREQRAQAKLKAKEAKENLKNS